MKTFEDHLRSQERRNLPPEWKESILTNAVADNDFPKPSIMAWLFPKPLRYGLAAAWIAIFSLSVSVSSLDPPEIAHHKKHPDQPIVLLASIQLAERFLADEEVLP